MALGWIIQRNFAAGPTDAVPSRRRFLPLLGVSGHVLGWLCYVITFAR